MDIFGPDGGMDVDTYLDSRGDDSQSVKMSMVEPQVIIYAPSKLLDPGEEAKPEPPTMNNRRGSSASVHKTVFQVRDSKGRFSSANKRAGSDKRTPRRTMLPPPQSRTPVAANMFGRRSSQAALISIAHQADFEDQASDIFDRLVGDGIPPPGQRPSSLSKAKKWLQPRPTSGDTRHASEEGSLYELPIQRHRRSVSENRPEATRVPTSSVRFSAAPTDNIIAEADDGSPKKAVKSAKNARFVPETPDQADETDVFFDASEGHMDQDTVDESVYLTPNGSPNAITKKVRTSTLSLANRQATSAVGYPSLTPTSPAGSSPATDEPSTLRRPDSFLVNSPSTRMPRNHAADFFEKVETAPLYVASPPAALQHSHEDAIADDLLSDLAAGMWAQHDELSEAPSPTSEIDLPSSLHGQDIVQPLIAAVNTSVTTDKMAKKAKAKGPPTKSPFFKQPTLVNRSKVKIIDAKPTTPKKSRSTTSTSPNKRSPGGLISCIPFPPLSSPTFGLIQEKLAHDPFRLLIAVTFLNRTRGKQAIPVFYDLVQRYPTPELLANANKEDIVEIIKHLGLQNQRAGTYLQYARQWVEDPPIHDKRYSVRGYPDYNSGRDIKKGEIITDSDARVGWEIGHMTQGPYAIDSWRIFCRDVLRGVATGWNGEGVEGQDGFQPEWMRVVPEDKELRAYLRWMWLKEGFEWDPFTGDKDVAGEELMRAAQEGRIAWDDLGGMRILEDGANDDEETLKQQVATQDSNGT